VTEAGFPFTSGGVTVIFSAHMKRESGAGRGNRSRAAAAGGSTTHGQRAPEGYVKSGAAVAAAIVCLGVGIFGGWMLGRGTAPGSPGTASRAQPLVTPLAKGGAAQNGAIEALREKTRTAPRSAAAWTALGNAYFDAAQYTAAIEAYTRSLQIAPGDPDVLTDLGIMYRSIGLPEKAIEQFDTASRADPKHENSLFNKGVVLMHDLQDTAGARIAWEKLRQLHPGFVTAGGQSIEMLLKNLP